MDCTLSVNRQSDINFFDEVACDQRLVHEFTWCWRLVYWPFIFGESVLHCKEILGNWDKLCVFWCFFKRNNTSLIILICLLSKQDCHVPTRSNWSILRQTSSPDHYRPTSSLPEDRKGSVHSVTPSAFQLHPFISEMAVGRLDFSWTLAHSAILSQSAVCSTWSEWFHTQMPRPCPGW